MGSVDPQSVSSIEGADRWQPRRYPWTVMLGLLAATALVLQDQGRGWWCACGSLTPWSGEVRTTHISRHLIDPYSITHILHGFLFCGLVNWIFPRLSRAWSLAVVVGVEALWEVLENSRFIIERFRTTALVPDHNGDSIANSLVDILACALGVIIAQRIGLRWSLVIFVAAEIALMVWIGDSLTLILLKSIGHAR